MHFVTDRMTESASAARRYAARDERLVQSLGQAMMQKVDESILKELTSWPYPSKAIPKSSFIRSVSYVRVGGRSGVGRGAITIDETVLRTL